MLLSDGELKQLLVHRLRLVQKNLDVTDDVISRLSEVRGQTRFIHVVPSGGISPLLK